MVDSPQEIVVEKTIDKPGKTDVILGLQGDAPQKLKEQLYLYVFEAGVNPSDLTDEEGFSIGQVWFKKEVGCECEIKEIELKEWVKEGYS